MEEVSAEGNRPERTDDDYGHIDGKNHSKTPGGGLQLSDLGRRSGAHRRYCK